MSHLLSSVEERREAESAGVYWDWQVQLRVLDQEVTLLVEVKNSGEPRFVRAMP